MVLILCFAVYRYVHFYLGRKLVEIVIYMYKYTALAKFGIKKRSIRPDGIRFSAGVYIFLFCYRQNDMGSTRTKGRRFGCIRR